MWRLFERTVIFTLILLASGAGVGAYFGSQNTTDVPTAEGGGLPIQLTMGVLYVCFFALLLRKRKSAVSLIVSERWMVALWLLAMASVLWSVDGGETLRKSVALLGTTVAGLYIGMRYEPRQQIKLVATCTAIGALASLVVCLLVPGIGVMPDHTWQGVYYPKNALARMMVLGVLSCGWLAIRQRHRRILYSGIVVLCLFLLLMAGSATGIVVSAALLALLPFRRAFSWPRRRLVALIVVAALVVVPVGTWALHHIEVVTDYLSRTPSLTGRLPLWHMVKLEISTRPYLGFGYGAYWTSPDADRVRRIVEWEAPNAHNGFLEMELGLGSVGLLIFLAGILRNLIVGIRVAGATGDMDDAWPVFFLVFAMLYNLTETTLIVSNSIFTILYIANSYWLVRTSLQPFTEEENDTEPASAMALETPIGFKPAES